MRIPNKMGAAVNQPKKKIWSKGSESREQETGDSLLYSRLDNSIESKFVFNGTSEI